MIKRLAARIYVDKAILSFDKAFDYSVPYDLADEVFVGQRVIVPFGKANRKRQGIIAEIIKRDCSELAQLKPITGIVDKERIITDEMMKIAAFIKEYNFCTFYEAIKPMIPVGINVSIVAVYEYNKNADKLDDSVLDDENKRIVAVIKNARAPIERERLLEIFELDDKTTVFDNLEALGFITRLDNAIRKVGDASVRMVRLSEEFDETVIDSLTPKQQTAVGFIAGTQSASVKEVCYFTGVSASVVTNLIKKGVLEAFDNNVYRMPYESCGKGEKTEIILNDEQYTAYKGIREQINEKSGTAALLYGVTGSGKTQVFLKAIDDVVVSGKGIIVMVPEIALTPQTMNIFRSRYGDSVAILHSAMSLGKRTDEWKRIRNGDAQIAIGTRSAIFAPFKEIGLIIMDEEQEHTYKSESTPRFHARDIAKFRCNYHKCPFIMASATPSVETYSLAKSGRIPLYTLNNRYGTVSLPKVIKVNMLEQYKKGDFGILSETLKNSISTTLENKKQAIILLNRRGYHVFVSCRSCATVRTCPNCSISLTYHSANNRCMCHYCGYSEEFTQTCPSCGEQQIKLSGFGTQKVEEQLGTLFPKARVLRMDADTTMTRQSHEKKFHAFAEGDYDIMVGTQMVAKGLDFPNVTLVGVINADQSLFGNDFRAFEKTFSLLTQVVGRSGRGKDEGTAVIQTIAPDNEIIDLSAKQDYEKFYETEILARKMMIYPPYCDLIVIGFASLSKENAKKAAEGFFNTLKRKIETDYSDLKMFILGPSPCAVPKVSSNYRYRMILKCKNSKRLRQLVMSLLSSVRGSAAGNSVKIFADLNPETII